MSDQEQLPVCRLCGEPPGYYGKLVGCSKPCCGVRSALMTSYDWRRLMARPRLAPEHVLWLRNIAECSEYGMKAYEDLIQDADPGVDLKHVMEYVESYRADVAAIRAALAALGSEND